MFFRSTGETAKSAAEKKLRQMMAGLLFELREVETGEYLFPDEQDWYLQDPARLSKRIQQLFTDCGIQTQKAGTGRAAYKEAVEAWEKRGKRGPKPVYERAGDEQKAQAIAALPAIEFEGEENSGEE